MHNRAFQRARSLAGPAGPLPRPSTLQHAPSPALSLGSSTRRPSRLQQSRCLSPSRATFHTSGQRRSEQPTETSATDPAAQAVEAKAEQAEDASATPSEEESSPSKEEDKEDKPRRRKAATPRYTLASLPGELPAEYASSHLWLPGAPSSTTPKDAPGLPPPHILHEALTSFLLCLHPQTQHRSLFPGPGGQAQVEPTLALYCPIEGGDYVVDETVREIARHAGAEVVVLDAAHLAAGQYGVFGKSAVGFQLPSNPLQVASVAAMPSGSSSSSSNTSNLNNDPEEEDDLDMPPHNAAVAIQIPALMRFPPLSRTKLGSSSASTRGPQAAMRRFFEDVVNLPPAVPAASEGESNVPIPVSTTATPPVPAATKPRIIYIRDFGLLAPTASHWYPPLVEAVRARRAGPIPRPSQPPPNPTVIVFGCTPPLIPQIHVTSPPASSGLLSMLIGGGRPSGGVIRIEGSEEDDARGRERRLRERLVGWETNESLWLANELPPFAGSPSTSAVRSGATVTSAEPKGIVLSNFGGPGQDYAQPWGYADDAANASADTRSSTAYFRAVTLLPATRDPALETETRLARRRELNMLAMRMAVGAAGGVLPDLELNGQELEQEELWKEWGERVEPWSTLRAVASRAVGGVVAEQVKAGSPILSSLKPTLIPWTAILDAWAAQRSAGAARKAWVESAKSAVVLPPGSEDESKKRESSQEEEDEVIERVRRSEDLDESEQRLLGCIVDPRSMPTTFANVHLPPSTIDSIRTIVSLPLLHPQAFSQGILKQHAMTGALLFGVPGTGKTLVVRALAKESGARMLMIKPSDIMDMYVGNSEKLVRAVFSLARRLSPCIIFLDEIDALFGARVSARESGGAIAHRQVITEFMQEMDGLRTQEGGVIVIGATNRPFDLDDAVLRRLPRRLLVDLPGEKERAEILKILLRDEILAPEVDITALAKRTEGFSGSDLKHLCVSAALDAVKETVELPWAVPKHLIKDTLALTTPVPSAIPEQQASIPPKEQEQLPTQRESTEPAEGSEAPIADLTPQLDGSDAPPPPPIPPTPGPEVSLNASVPSVQRVLRPHHFAKALSEITASTSESLGTLSDLRKWNEEFGEGGSKRGRKKRWGDKFGFGLPDQSKNAREVGQVGGEP